MEYFWLAERDKYDKSKKKTEIFAPELAGLENVETYKVEKAERHAQQTKKKRKRQGIFA